MAQKTIAALPAKKLEAAKKIVNDTNLTLTKRIVTLGKKGLAPKQIIDLGFNKNTVYRQLREHLEN